MTDTTQPGLDSAYALKGPDDARRLYADWADTYDTDFARRTGYRPARRIAEEFVAAGGTGPVLDAGCGTGLVADALLDDIDVDGLDLSPEMLAIARAKGRYRGLIEADLTRPLDLADGAYRGLVSAGTFTHGHVWPEALTELLRVLAPGAVVALAVNADFAQRSGMDAMIVGLERAGRITAPRVAEEPIYDGPEPPEGHADATGLLMLFQRV
jgi:SAM-dependent methyltransferase